MRLLLLPLPPTTATKLVSIFILLLFITLTWITTFVLTEGFFHSRSHSDQNRFKTLGKERNVINTKEKAKEVLKQYGYLRCSIFHRRRHANPLGHGINRTQSKNSSVTKYCTPKEVREAARLYQRHYNVRVTGRLDAATLKLMSASRCGNPDDEVPIATMPISDSKVEDVVRKKRSSDSSSPNLLELLVTNRDLLKTSLQGNTVGRRKRWVENYKTKLKSGDVDRQLSDLHSHMHARRKKRSAEDNGTGGGGHAFSKDVISWRLINNAYSNQLTVNDQRTALALAFRMWSEVIPRVFYEDINSSVDDIDILIAFGRGEHMNCPNNFDGYGGQLSHAIRQYGGAEIHVDDDEYFTIDSEQGTNLLKVAVHEVGHVLGLIHMPRNYSIMYAIYSEALPNSNFELGWEDRKLVQSIYGICKGTFDTVFDWVRRRPDGQLIYNTYFFRGNHYWMYENRYNRTRYGDPLVIGPEWKGVPGDVDGFVHIWTYTQDTIFFFRGSRYWKYDSQLDEVSAGYPRNISQDFGPMISNATNRTSIPDNTDAVFFDKRDDNVYFFKHDKVYGYDPSKGREGCCLPGYPKDIREEFPNVEGSEPLPNNLDVVYYSYTDRSLYFFKGKYFWQNVAFSPLDRRRTNRVQGPWLINEKWYDICDVEFL